MQRARTALLAGLLVAQALSSAARVRAACGDGVVERAVELCDDGNVAAADGCDASCRSEAGYLCTGAPSLCCFGEAAAAYALRGEASFDANTGEVTLVPDALWKVGAAWFRQPLDFSRPFSIALQLYLGNRDDRPTANATDTGADGGALLFQRDPRGIAAEGAYGGELGAQGIMPVVAVEFDTYNNLAAYGDETKGDEDHLSVFHTRATPATNHLVPAVCLNGSTTCTNYEDGRYHRFVVSWTGAADHHLRVFVDGVQRIDLNNDLIANYFANDPAGITFGFAASTGGHYNLHKICPAAPSGYTIPRDFDVDGQDDRVDLDDDGDGHSDRDETSGVFGADDPSEDHDRDGVPNHRDPDYWRTVLLRPDDCADVVAPIGACDGVIPTLDFDRDGAIDFLDLDSDADGTPDLSDPARLDRCVPTASAETCVPIAADAGTPDSAVLDAGAPYTSTAPPASVCLADENDLSCPSADSDHDRAPNQTDPAPNDPCIPSAHELACATGDRDGDGLTNGFECPGLSQCSDRDGDGVADYADTDADGDGIPDRAECKDPTACSDSDGDGTPDVLEPAQSEGGCSLRPTSSSSSPLGWSTALLLVFLGSRCVFRKRLPA